MSSLILHRRASGKFGRHFRLFLFISAERLQIQWIFGVFALVFDAVRILGYRGERRIFSNALLAVVHNRWQFFQIHN